MKNLPKIEKLSERCLTYHRFLKNSQYIQNLTNYPIVIGRFWTRNRKKITIFLTSKLTNKTLFEIKSSLRQRHDIFSDCVKIIVLSWPFFVGNLKKNYTKKPLVNVKNMPKKIHERIVILRSMSKSPYFNGTICYLRIQGTIFLKIWSISKIFPTFCQFLVRFSKKQQYIDLIFGNNN